MDRRRLLLILAVFVALMGTALVFLYVKGADSRAAKSHESVTAYVAVQPVNAGESYDSAVTAGKITTQSVPKDFLTANNVPYVQTDADLKGKIAVAPILQGQVIVASQFGDTIQTSNTSLPIPKGMMAISVNLTDPDRVAGNIENGSQVAIFVTGNLDAATTPAASGATGNTDIQATRLLLPKVTVLNVGSPQPPTTATTTTTTTDENGTETTEQLPKTLLTIAVTQKEAQKVIVSSKALSLTFGLLTQESKVHPGPGTSTLVASLFR